MKSEVITFGCRLNSYESEVIREHLKNAGEENVLVFNTCAVTAEAERQARQAIRKYRKKRPDARIVVTGCAAQINPESYAAMPEVDQVLGNVEKLKQESYQTSDFRLQTSDIMSVKETAHHLVHGLEGRARAFVQVQNGCNHRCTFCIIPYGRGNSRSVPLGEIVAQTQTLLKNGYQEIVLTGVDISDYGKDLPGSPSLTGMIQRLFKQVPDLKRLRLSSIDVAEMDEGMFRLLAEEPRFMPHLHLSLQSGDDMILKRMKRRHLRKDILAFCEQARDLRPDIVFGADLIAGFPTETDAMFENSMKIIEEAELTWLHVFPYSARRGTPAARIPDQIPLSERKTRASALRAKGEIMVQRFMQTRIGKTERVIVEKPGLGRTEHFALMEFEDKNAPPGSVITLQAAGHTAVHLIGTHETL